MQIGIISFILLSALFGVPLFVIMTLIALTAFTFAGVETQAVAIEIYKVSAAPTLLAIPLFTFAGYLMAESKTPQRLLRFTDMALGWLPGGVSLVVLAVCAFFTSFTGASGVTIIALGGLLYPILKQEGYSEKFSLGLITTCGSLGLLFPPSLPIIIYGLVSGVDIEKLFLAGIIPGMILMGVLAFYALLQKKQIKLERKKFSLNELVSSFKGAFFEILLPIFVLAGIYGGFVTVSEAATLTVLYTIIMEFFIYKDLSLKRDLVRIIAESMTLVGAILLILCCAMGVTNYMVDEDIPMQLLAYMKTIIADKYTFLICLNIFLLVVGCLMDIFSAIIVVVPLILPIAREYGVDPIHLAIIFLTNLEIGYITPPVGINLFISSFRFKKPVLEMYKVSIPFLLILLCALLIITYIPALSLFLVGN